jgi:hypothetical protein
MLSILLFFQITEYCTFGSLFDFLHTTDIIAKGTERNSMLPTPMKHRFQVRMKEGYHMLSCSVI